MYAHMHLLIHFVIANNELSHCENFQVLHTTERIGYRGYLEQGYLRLPQVSNCSVDPSITE